MSAGLHIAILAQCYAPEDVSAAVLITELATDLVKRGHEVTLVTCAPNYPQGRVFPGYRNRLWQTERREGVRVVRTWSYISSARSFWPRALGQATWCATSLLAAFTERRPDVVMSYSPPLPLGVTAWMLSRLWRARWVLQVNDVYPDAAIAAGVLRSRVAIAALSALESSLYRAADHVSVIADSFRANLLAKGVPGEKITAIPVWADPDAVRPLPKATAFRERHRLGDDFVVLYAGNVGVTSCLEDVLAAAAMLRDDPAIRFVVVGEGVRKESLVRDAHARGLANVLFLPYEPRERFAELMASADVGLVTLNARSALASLPSKTFNVMASARPVLAVAPLDGDLATIVREAGCGVAVAPGDPAGLAGAIRALRRDPDALVALGRHGRATLEARFSRAACVDAYESLFLSRRRRPTSAAAHDGAVT